MSNNGDMPAGVCPDVYHENGQIETGPGGLTKREHFAALAMQGLLASGRYPACNDMSEEAWAAADSMLWAQEHLARIEKEHAK